MKGSEDKLLIFMEGNKKRFTIPVYQRNYDWKIEQCKQLYDDLIKIVRQNRKSHFFGSIVSSYNSEGGQLDFLIIDGQQRLTTVSLLLLAIYKLISEGELRPEKEYLGDQIYETYLVDKWEPKETRMKLKPIKNDQNAFKRLFEDDNDYIKESNLTINYNYFIDRLRRNEVQVDDLFEAIFKLEIISIVLNEDDNAQLIFESLNSTGLDLSEGDKIRNYILMGESPSKQEDLYNKYWNKIEKNTDYDVSLFIRDYLSIKQQSTPAFRDVYARFKEYVEDNEFNSIEELLSDILYYSKKYEYLLKANSPWRSINHSIYRLNRMKTTVTRPFLMEVLQIAEKGQASEEELVAIFSLIENYIFRRSICDIPTNALNKIFLLLNKEILRLDGSNSNYIEKMKYVLINKKESGRYPDDEEFTKALSEKNIYAMRGETKLYLFERLENFGTLETKNVWEHFDENNYSIEHIMPQKLNQSWMDELGRDYERIHEVWLHRLANLTITAYNSKYSNRKFLEKRDMEKGFSHSGIRLNQWLNNKSQWTEIEIEERDLFLQNKALTIWPYPRTDYLPKEIKPDYVSLDEEVSLTGKIIKSFALWGDEEDVESWTEMYQRVLQILHNKDKSILTKLSLDKESDRGLSIHFSNIHSDFKTYKKIDNNIFVWVGTHTQYKINVLKEIFDLFRIDQGDLIFNIDNSSEDSTLEHRHIIRRRYWEEALPKIREVTGTCSNVNPSKSNWLNAFTGIGGIKISFIANYDSARVELYIEKDNPIENKNIFDYLYSMKEDIEREANTKFLWDRKDQLKASSIYLELLDVGITNEDDWEKMIDFHAKSGKIIKDTFIDKLIQYIG